MRFPRVFFAAALVLASAFPIVRLAVRNGLTEEAVEAADAGDTALDLFRNRALTAHAPNPAATAALEQSDLAKAYYAIRPARSILIYDCATGSPWCADSAFSFAAMFQQAARIAAQPQPDPDSLAASWYRSAVGPRDPAGNVQDQSLPVMLPAFAADRFQLLAIANRMDHARYDNAQWVGAEVHFVYGLIPPGDVPRPPELLTIMEFRLPPMTKTAFRDLARQWQSLSNIGNADYAKNFTPALKRVLQQSGFAANALDPKSPTALLSVSSRLNHILLGGTWIVSQIVLDPQSNDPRARRAFAPRALDDQIEPRPDIGSKAYRDLFVSNPTTVESGALHIRIPPSLQASAWQPYQIPLMSLGLPRGVCDGNPNRDVLATQQCTWCHGTETNTTFTHIPNRFPKASSLPSGFLVGPGPNAATIQPTLTDLYNRNPSAVWAVSTGHEVWLPDAEQKCTTQSTTTDTRYFHDIARRTLFLAFVFTEDPTKMGPPKAAGLSAMFAE